MDTVNKENNKEVDTELQEAAAGLVDNNDPIVVVTTAKTANSVRPSGSTMHAVKRKTVTTIRHSISRSGDETVNNDEIWVKPTDDKSTPFPFGKTRRVPYFWFNRFLFCCSLTFFFYFAVQIVKEYIDSRTNPPTSTKWQHGADQLFPGMAFCMHQTTKATQPSLEPLFAVFHDQTDEGTTGIDYGSLLKRIDCNNRTGTTNSTTSLLWDDDGLNNGDGGSGSGNTTTTDERYDKVARQCWILDDYEFAAFNISSTCTHRNTLNIGFYFNKSLYDPNVMLVGVDGYLYQQGQSDQFIDEICSSLSNPVAEQCTNNMMQMKAVANSDVDPGGVVNNNVNGNGNEDGNGKCESAFRLDTFISTNGLSNSISMERSQIQQSPVCPDSKNDRIHWNPQSTVANHNVNYQIPPNDRNITMKSSMDELQSTIFMEFLFRNGDIMVTKYKTESFASMFGSLGGWWGFLSDGWGILTVVMIIEETINWIIATKF